ncbi:MAG: CRISPR-associated endonuclease Cas1, partial [Pyrinomonadaceae bacterium]|nr:CRISPR-associated endonuclease Cas1 [Pyrinomonadaceae bacterium]
SAEQLQGVEGAASKSYFQAFWMFNKSEFAWEGRRMHPPPDALNSLLSLTYTLLTGELTGLLESSGLDPYLGFLHQIDYLIFVY